jgi:hypothetical protein
MCEGQERNITWKDYGGHRSLLQHLTATRFAVAQVNATHQMFALCKKDGKPG